MVTEAPFQSRTVTLEDVTQVVTSYYGVTLEDLRSPAKTAELAHQRQVYMHLGRTLAGMTCREIGEVIDRDHSTVAHGSALIERLLRSDADLRYDCEVMAAEAIALAGARMPAVRIEPPKVELFSECRIEVSRYVFGLNDLASLIQKKNVPPHAWVAVADCGMNSLRITFRWSKDDEVAS